MKKLRDCDDLFLNPGKDQYKTLKRSAIEPLQYPYNQIKAVNKNCTAQCKANIYSNLGNPGEIWFFRQRLIRVFNKYPTAGGNRMPRFDFLFAAILRISEAGLAVKLNPT